VGCDPDIAVATRHPNGARWFEIVDTILDFVAAHPRGFSTRFMARELGWTYQITRDRLARMVKYEFLWRRKKMPRAKKRKLSPRSRPASRVRYIYYRNSPNKRGFIGPAL